MEDNKPTTITIDDVEYVRKDSVTSSAPAVNTEGLPYVVVRSRDAGCHAGYMKNKLGNNVTLLQSRRLWYWEGAATLSQLSQEGVKSASDCKFPCEVGEIEILGACEVIYATEQAESSIKGVPVWEMK